jgi:hypothetical protein
VKFIKTIIKKEFITLLISIIMIGVIFSPICTSTIIKIGKKQVLKSNDQINNYGESRGTEYWALIVAVGVYYNHPSQDRPEMLDAADNLYSSLLESPNWQAENIHVLKGSQATATNVIKELIWLIKSADSDDMSLVYITTHGAPLVNHMDLPPKDEADGVDECLIMYYGFEDYNDKIVDDTLSFFFRLLQSKGLCVIIDSCYSGGFDDPINIKQTQTLTKLYSNFVSIKVNGLNKAYEIKQVNNDLNEKNSKVKEFTNDFTEDLAAQGRVVLMSCTEEELSYGSFFSDCIISGFNGLADFTGNHDGINSAEEAYNFAYTLVIIFSSGSQHPTIVDRYQGDFPVTYN